MGQTTRLYAIILTCFLLLTGGCATAPTGAPESNLPRHNRIVAIGDVHGSYKGLMSILKETRLIDADNRWIGGRALLVQDGDLLDRGAEVRKVMDLLMSLQQRATAAGGKVVVVLGNHEAMNMVGSLPYVNTDTYNRFVTSASEEKREKAFAQWQRFFVASSGGLEALEAAKQDWMAKHPPGFVEYMEAMGPGGHYGKWLRSLPAVFQYGGSIFLHGGISPDNAEKSVTEVNQEILSAMKEFDAVKAYLIDKGWAEQFFTISEMGSVVDGILTAAETQELPKSMAGELPRLKEIKTYLDGFYETSPLMIDGGVLWFRGFTTETDEQLEAYLPQWLKRNTAWRVVAAHTPTQDGRILSRLDGSVFLIDTGMNTDYFKGGRASALEIQDDDVTAVYAGGERTVFPPPKIDYGPKHVWMGPDGAPLPFESPEEIEAFLRTAEPVFSKVIRSGVNRPLKVLLEKNGTKINTIFRHESESAAPDYLGAYGKTKPRYFIDSYLGEIAAYGMNQLLGLNNMPPTVDRSLNGMHGTLQLWAEGTMPDRQRAQEDILPPEASAWNRQMWDMRVFDNLINNVDRNQTNILIDPNWRLILIDHSRSFARDTSLPIPEQVIHCSRGLWHALRHLDKAEVRRRLSPYFNEAEIEALFERRDRLVQLIEDLIDRNGEESVLF